MNTNKDEVTGMEICGGKGDKQITFILHKTEPIEFDNVSNQWNASKRRFFHINTIVQLMCFQINAYSFANTNDTAYGAYTHKYDFTEQSKIETTPFHI